MLTIRDLTTPFLPPVSLMLEDGQCIALQGPSGAGKSVLLRAIADLDPNLGQIQLDGRDRNSYSAPHWRALVGYLPAEPGWWADRVDQHFLDWARLSPIAPALHLRPDIGAAQVSHCSTGERQRLALLRALERRPRVLLLDEPTGGLDPASVEAVEQLLAEQQAAGLSMIWVTHDPAQAERIAHCRLILHKDGLQALNAPSNPSDNGWRP